MVKETKALEGLIMSNSSQYWKVMELKYVNPGLHNHKLAPSMHHEYLINLRALGSIDKKAREIIFFKNRGRER